MVRNYLTVGEKPRDPLPLRAEFVNANLLKRCVMSSTEYYRRQAHAFLQKALISSDREETKRLLGVAYEFRRKADDAEFDTVGSANAVLPARDRHPVRAPGQR